MTTFYRAKLTLDEVEPYTDSNGYRREHTTEISVHTVTGDTPADAMWQIHGHAGLLLEWHQDHEDEPSPEPVRHLHIDADHPLAKAFAGVGKALLGEDAEPVGPLRHMRVTVPRERAEDEERQARADAEAVVTAVTESYAGRLAGAVCKCPAGLCACEHDGEPDQLDRDSAALLAAGCEPV